ncbi:MAG: hypothetical protein HY744_18065 [Deltaproteobacteria bacterium]|nr:hypothetical protein [Deltaproteobacteria bacterium]
MAKVDALLVEYHKLRQGSADDTGPGGPLERARTALVLRQARKLLEDAQAARRPEPIWRYRLGHVLYLLFDLDGRSERLEQAAEHLHYVSESPAPAAVRAEALYKLALCFARLGRPEAESQAYSRALALEADPEARAVMLANRAESYMLEGKLAAAVAGYRASLAETPGYALSYYGVTTLWGLAVALDRSGDLAGALEQIRLARTYDPRDGRLQSDSWFFVPDYEESWYAALGHWQRARAATDPASGLTAYEAAVLAWGAYLERASPDDRWLDLAAVRRRQCELEMRRALGRAP